MFFSSFLLLYAQNLLNIPIRQVASRKKAVYLNNSIIYGGNRKIKCELTELRSAYHHSAAYERLVFQFSGEDVPYIYGYFKEKDKKLYLDFFSVKLKDKLKNEGKGHFISTIEFFKMNKDSLSLEIFFNQDVQFDIFYLKSPSRLIIDIKN